MALIIKNAHGRPPWAFSISGQGWRKNKSRESAPVIPTAKDQTL